LCFDLIEEEEEEEEDRIENNTIDEILPFESIHGHLLDVFS